MQNERYELPKPKTTSRSGTFSFFLFPAYWNDGGNFKGSFHKAIFLSNSKRCFEQKPISLEGKSLWKGLFLANQHNGVLMKIFESSRLDLWDSMVGTHWLYGLTTTFSDISYVIFDKIFNVKKLI